MCHVVTAVGGPSTAELLQASEWSGSSEQPMLFFDLGNNQIVESVEYRIFLVTTEVFVISVVTLGGLHLEIIWEPAKQKGRCLPALSTR